MRRTPVERVTLKLSAQPRLASVVRAAVRWQARAWGAGGPAAAALAAQLARSFREALRGAGEGRGRVIHISLEARVGEILARFSPGGGGRVLLFRARRSLPALGRRPRRGDSGREPTIRRSAGPPV